MPLSLDPNRILIVLQGSIGDVTRAFPLPTLVRSGYPRARLAWAVEPQSLPLVQGYPAVDEIILFDRRRWWVDFWPFLNKIRSKKFDLVIDLQRHLKSGFFSPRSGAPPPLGFYRGGCRDFQLAF